MTRRKWRSYLVTAVTFVLAMIWLMPLVFSVLMSLRPATEPINVGNIFFGSTLTLDNYHNAWQVAPWGRHYLNSLIFVFGTLIVQLVTITMAGYAFARLRFWGRDVLLGVLLLQLMIPTGVLLVQNFATVRTLGLFDTHWALMMPYWGSAFGVLMMRQTFRAVPFELEEAARSDGANWWQLIRHVYVPLSLPAYISFAIVSISSHWNEFLWPFIVTRSEDVRPLTAGLNKLFFTTEVGAQYGQLLAGTLIVIAPLVVLFVFFQRQFIESFASSGLK